MTRARDIADDTIVDTSSFLTATSNLDAAKLTTGTIPNARYGTPTFNGSNLTGVGGGITEFDQWRVNTAFGGDAEPITSNWERPDTGNFEKIGTGMSQSSGIFTFPSTGKYWVQFAGGFSYNGNSNYNHVYIETTNNNSSYTYVAQGTVSSSSNARAGQAHITYLFDVTNTTTHKVRFSIVLHENSTIVNADTGMNVVYASFIRIGDT